MEDIQQYETVREIANTPRSYIVDTQTGTMRKNTSTLVPQSVPNNDGAKESALVHNNVQNKAGNGSPTPMKVNQNGKVATRSGRQINKPVRYEPE